MRNLPEREEQIRNTHAELIHQVVAACQNLAARKELEPQLDQAKTAGWEKLVNVIRQVMNGDRREALLRGLDEEDAVIVRSILEGLQNPASLPDISAQGDASVAAPGLAAMIHAAGRGDSKALQVLADMAEQMVRVGGDMGRLGGITRKLLDGERDPDILCQGMDNKGRQLVLDLIEELNKLQTH